MDQERTVPEEQKQDVSPTTATVALKGEAGNGPLLEMRGIDKAFPGVQALSAADLTLHAGEILALVGENGAGKSTLIKVLTGLYQPEAGEIVLDGEVVKFSTPRDAMSRGIAHMPQERNLVPYFSVGENIMLESLPRGRFGLIDYERIHREARRWLDMLDVKVDSRASVEDLSIAQRQLVEIARAISREGRILVLDEPTASLTPHETQVLFGVLRRLRDQGVAVIFVSHKLEEVFALCDSITVLRDGKNAGPQTPISEIDRDQVITRMVGRASVKQELTPRQQGRGGPVLELRRVDTSSGGRDITFTVHSNEIVGLYGLVGAGRTELARAIIGIDKVIGGEVLVKGQKARIRNVKDALVRYRIGYVSENRKEEGLIQMLSLVSNVSITIWRKLQNWAGWISSRAERKTVQPFVDRLDIKAPSLNTAVASLSGGNQQKVSLAKWLAAGVDVLIIDEPTVGIDVRTKANLHELIWELVERGLGIVLISSDMPEMVRLADRILVMRHGRIAGEISNDHDYEKASEQIMGFIH
jgi:ribose transport system ATP-binding protein